MKALFAKLSFLTLICLARGLDSKDLYDTTTSVKTSLKERDETTLRKNENLLMKLHADKFAEQLIEIGNTELGTKKIKVSII